MRYLVFGHGYMIIKNYSFDVEEIYHAQTPFVLVQNSIVYINYLVIIPRVLIQHLQQWLYITINVNL